MLAVSVVISAATLGSDYLVAMWIGFPVPFTFVLCSAVWLPFVLLSFLAIGARQILSNGYHRQHMINALRVWMCQFCLIGAWTLYFVAIVATPESLRPGVMVVLPIMKVILRRGFSRALPHLEEEGPEIVTFNTDVFSSLFLSISTHSTSLTITIGLMIIDSTKGLWTIREVLQTHKALASLNSIITKHTDSNNFTRFLPIFPMSSSGSDRLAVVQKEARQLQSVRALTSKPEPIMMISRIVLSMPGFCRLNVNRVAPKPDKANERFKLTVNQQAATQNSQQLRSCLSFSKDEKEFVELGQRFLHTMEFVLLLNYVDAAVPLMYGAFLQLLLLLMGRACS